MTVQESIERLNAALDRLDAGLGPDGQLVDAELLELAMEWTGRFSDDGEHPVVRSAAAPNLDRLRLYFEDRFERPLPVDLIQLLNRRNGIVLTSSDDTDPYFDSSCFLTASEIYSHAISTSDYLTFDGEPLPTLPFAVSWPGGPMLALWIEDGPGPYRVVAYDHEASSDRFIDVVADHLGHAVEAYIECGLSVLDATVDVIDSIDQAGSQDEYEAELAEKERVRRTEKKRTTAAALEDRPTDHPPGEVFLLCHKYVDGEVYQLNRWANVLTPYLCENDEGRTADRHYLARIALAYEQEFPDKGEALRRNWLDGWLRFPRGEEAALEPMEPPSGGWPTGGELRASYWLAFLSCLFMPGIGHFQAGQKAKGIVLGLSILVTCGLMWLLTPITALDLYAVRKARLKRDVGPFEFFPS